MTVVAVSLALLAPGSLVLFFGPSFLLALFPALIARVCLHQYFHSLSRQVGTTAQKRAISKIKAMAAYCTFSGEVWRDGDVFFCCWGGSGGVGHVFDGILGRERETEMAPTVLITRTTPAV